LCAKITLPQGNNRNISFGNPENAHIFGRRDQGPALRYPKDIFIFNSSLNRDLVYSLRVAPKAPQEDTQFSIVAASNQQLAKRKMFVPGSPYFGNFSRKIPAAHPFGIYAKIQALYVPKKQLSAPKKQMLQRFTWA